MADTHAAASCSYADVVAAIGLATSGDTVTVPAGAATWASQLVVTKGLNIIAAGIGQTVITNGWTPALADWTNNNQDSFLIRYNPSDMASNHPFRMNGFDINCSATCNGIFIGYGNTTSVANNKIRIDHNRIVNTRRPIQVHGNFYGVADNNIFSCSATAIGHYGRQAASWTYFDFNFGSANQFYFEDNTIDSPYLSHGGYGGRYCLRHNVWTATTSANIYPMCDFHGNQPGEIYAEMGVEIYENTFILGSRSGGMFDGRGGKSLIYNNNVTTTGSISSKWREENNDNIALVPKNVISGQPQHVSDSYAWANTKNGTTAIVPYIGGTVDYGGSIGLVPQFNVDCWKQVTPFTGADGVGVGTLAQRPTSGLAVGVGYWATDTQTLYRATSATAWQAYYTPYAYPHPLRDEAYPEPGDPTVLVTYSASILHAATSPVLVPEVDYILGVADATLALEADYLTVTPIEPTPWEIRLGVLGGEELLPPLNWPVGSSPEMPEGTTAYVDSVALADGSVRHNFRTYSPRKWTHEWAQLTAAQVGVFNELVAHAVPLHYQNKWVNADWHWVIITACDPIPLTTTFTTGTPFWKLTLELEEIL